jgi:hypothetical protein
MNFEGYKIHTKRATRRMIPFFCHLVDFLYSLGLKFVAPSVNKCARNFHARKHVKLYIKIYVFIFYNCGFLPKYLCITTYACEKTPPPWKVS